jgi:hypothetical protein
VVTWGAFSAAAPALAAAGRSQLYQWGIGLAFLATVRPDGGPRVHPVCPLISEADGLLVLINPGPKQRDLLRDGRYALHGETFAPPRHDDGFYLTGSADRVTDDSVLPRFAAQLAAERDDSSPAWTPGLGDVLFELHISTALLMLTSADDNFPAGPTVWKAD